VAPRANSSRSAIGDILLENLGRRLTRVELLELLEAKEIHPLTSDSRRSASEQLRAVTNSWRESVKRELLQPRIERSEAVEAIESLHDRRVAFVSGTAGGGKSSVLEQVRRGSGSFGWRRCWHCASTVWNHSHLPQTLVGSSAWRPRPQWVLAPRRGRSRRVSGCRPVGCGQSGIWPHARELRRRDGSHRRGPVFKRRQGSSWRVASSTSITTIGFARWLIDRTP
jgi:hypothetical protein